MRLISLPHLQRFDFERFSRHLRRLTRKVTPDFRPKHAQHPNLQTSKRRDNETRAGLS